MGATATILITAEEAMGTGPSNPSREISTEIREETVEVESVLPNLTGKITR
jgi:hypothetical protein